MTFKDKMLSITKEHKERATKDSVWALIILTVFLVFLYSPTYETYGWQEEADKGESLAVFHGEIMPGREVNRVIDQNGREALFENFEELYERADYVSGNLKTPIITEELDTYDMNPRAENFYTDEKMLKVMEQAGFTTLSLANNTTMAFGLKGKFETLEWFNQVDIESVGSGMNEEEAGRVVYQDVNGVRFATVALADTYVPGHEATGHRGGVMAMDPERYIPVIQEAKGEADVVVVNVHWGREYDRTVHERQRFYAESFSDLGVDVVIGTGSNVLSEFEKIDDTYVFYNLGNFVHDQGWRNNKFSIIPKMFTDGENHRFELVPIQIQGGIPGLLSGWNEKIVKSEINNLMNRSLEDDEWEWEKEHLILE